MEILEGKKLDIHLAQLQERYDALHKMRDRSMQFALWILGFGLGMAWLLISEAGLTNSQKWAITVLLVVLGIVTFLFLYAMAEGFRINRQIAIRLETALGLYDENCYGIREAVLPQRFSCRKVGWRGHFKALYGLITVVFITLIVLTWTNPYKPKSTGVCTTLDANQKHTQAIINE